MLGSVAASKAAKAAALCICPVVGTAVVTTQVPAVRQAVHNATAPKAPKRARLAPKRQRLAMKPRAAEKALPICADPIPVVLGNSPVKITEAPVEAPKVSLSDPASRVPAAPVTTLMRPRIASFRPTGPVPEPAAWVQMMGGFAVVGATIRYSRRQRAVAPGTDLA